MPGFIIGGQGGPATTVPNNRDWMRAHRFRLLDFFGQLTNSATEFLALKDVTLPEKKIKSIDVKTPGTTYKFASQADYSNLKMVFYGSRTLLAKCYQMQDKVHNTREGLRDYHDYKGEVKFRMIDVPSVSVFGFTIDRASGMEYLFKNAFISNIQHSQVSYSSSEIFQVTANIEFDFFEATYFDLEAPTTKIVSNDSVEDQLGPYNGEI